MQKLRVLVQDLRTEENLEIAEHVKEHKPEQDNASDRDENFLPDRGLVEQDRPLHRVLPCWPFGRLDLSAVPRVARLRSLDGPARGRSLHTPIDRRFPRSGDELARRSPQAPRSNLCQVPSIRRSWGR